MTKRPNRRDFLAANATGALAAVLPGLFPRVSHAKGNENELGEVPFFSARSDTEAPLACARMALSFFEPHEHFIVSRVAEMIFHRPGYWVFEAQLMPMLADKGYRVKLHADTPYAELAKGKASSRYGKDADGFIDCEALSWALSSLKKDSFDPCGASLSRALRWHEKGELVIIGASPKVLRNDPGLSYCRYDLLLCGHGEKEVVAHDPCGGPYQKIPRKLLEKAFSEPACDRAVLRIARL